MKTLKDLSNMFDRWVMDVDKNVIEAERITSQQVYEDVVENAPRGATENYVNSIIVEEPVVRDNVISVFIGSDLMTDETIWGNHFGSNNAPTGTRYNLGYLLENGTLEHAIPNAFNRGKYFGWESPEFIATLQDNWHPGTLAQPHYSLALVKNKKFYKDNIKMVWRGK